MRKSFYIILTTLFLASMVSASDVAATDPRTDALFIRASMYDYQGSFEEAVDLYEQILEDTDSEYIYSRLAEDYARLNDGQSLRLTLERGLRHNPDSVLLMGMLADFYRLNPDTVQKAYDLYNQAYKISKDEKYLEGLAAAYAVKQDYNGAIAIYNKLIEKDKRSDYLVGRGRLYGQLGLEKESLADYTEAAEIDENYFAAGKLADYYIIKNDGEKAVKYLKMLIENRPDNVLAKFRLAELLKKLGKVSEAAQFYESLTKNLTGEELNYVFQQLAAISYTEQDYKKAYEYFLKAYEQNKDIKSAYSAALSAEAFRDYDSAEKLYLQILEQRPDFFDVRKKLSIIYLRSKQPDMALSVLEKADTKNADIELFRLRAEAYSNKKEYEKAEMILLEAIKDNEADVYLRMDLALLYDRMGKRDKAVDVAKAGLKFSPENESMLNFVGYMYADQGINLKEAKEMIKKALDKKPNEPAYLDSMAWVLFKMGKYKDAYKFQKQALKITPDEPELIEHMKAILQKMGKNKSIEDVLKED